MDLFSACESVYKEVGSRDFYRDIFGFGVLQKKGEYWQEGDVHRYNGIVIRISKSGKVRRYTVTDDLDILDELQECDDFCVMSPISYVGKERNSSNARFLHAIAIDLDGVETMKNWQFLIHQIENGINMTAFVWGLPCPTYIVASGNGLHLYFVFERPIPLFPNIVDELEKLRRRITWQAWTQGASTLHDNVQYESLYQGFRVVGTITKNGSRARAFKVGDKVTVEYLNQFVPDDYQVKTLKYKSVLSLKEAQEKYPDWYDRRIVKKEASGQWTCKRDLYDWWIRKLKAGAKQGHRYWCLMTLATYAVKCGIEYDELERDALELVPFLDSLGDAFTNDDAYAALAAYKESYHRYPIKIIEARTDINIPRNKRNGRKQAVHLQIARSTRDILHPEGWQNKKGQPNKQEEIRKYRHKHPAATKAQCNRDTGIDPKTIRKWWDPVLNEEDKKAGGTVLERDGNKETFFPVDVGEDEPIYMTKEDILEQNIRARAWDEVRKQTDI